MNRAYKSIYIQADDYKCEYHVTNIYIFRHMKNILVILAFFLSSYLSSQPNHPYLQIKGNTTQLIVKGEPYLILGGELGNSTATTMEYMKPVWSKLKDLNVNTMLVPIFWELIEEDEGKFNFTLVDELILEARNNNLKIVILWFGSWKNSMSSHVPGWVKKNQDRFPRIKDENARSHEILTPFSENNLQADLKAFVKLMEHIKAFDENENTVIMMQVENEIGMLPSARDYYPLANKAFEEQVPKSLMQYLQKNKDILTEELLVRWDNNGNKSSGTWEEVFGEGIETDEFFMAYYYSKFTNKLIEAGKAIYPLPMFVNAALNRPGRVAGKSYPSAGPLPHVIDFWKAAGPAIDFFSPDFYTTRFKHWNDLYTRNGNPLFIPEHRFDNTVAPKAIYAIGHYEAIGFCPFSIESKEEELNEPLRKAYDLLDQLSIIITSFQGQEKIDAVLLDKEIEESVLRFGDFEFTVKHSYTLGYEANSKNEVWETSGALIVQTGENEFYLAGSGVVITFKNLKNPDLNVGILKTEEGKFVSKDSFGENNKWKVIRHLNGDQTHQGRHIRIFFDDYSIQRFELYNYE